MDSWIREHSASSTSQASGDATATHFLVPECTTPAGESQLRGGAGRGDEASNWAWLLPQAENFGVRLTQQQCAQLREYCALLCEWNQRLNLTSVSTPEQIVAKHFLDSLTAARAADFSVVRSLVDVGAGAGFPGLVLKIAFPHLQVTLLDAVRKRLRFVERVAEVLMLQEVRTVHARAEDAGRPPGRMSAGREVQADGSSGAPFLREVFDVATARAVARLNVLCEWTLQLVRVGGGVVALKGPDVGPEVVEAETAITLLGGGPPQVHEFTLPGTDAGRSLVWIPKQRSTPRTLPRLPGTARKSPLS